MNQELNLMKAQMNNKMKGDNKLTQMLDWKQQSLLKGKLFKNNQDFKVKKVKQIMI